MSCPLICVLLMLLSVSQGLTIQGECVDKKNFVKKTAKKVAFTPMYKLQRTTSITICNKLDEAATKTLYSSLVDDLLPPPPECYIENKQQTCLDYYNVLSLEKSMVGKESLGHLLTLLSKLWKFDANSGESLFWGPGEVFFGYFFISIEAKVYVKPDVTKPLFKLQDWQKELTTKKLSLATNNPFCYCMQDIMKSAFSSLSTEETEFVKKLEACKSETALSEVKKLFEWMQSQYPDKQNIQTYVGQPLTDTKGTVFEVDPEHIDPTEHMRVYIDEIRKGGFVFTQYNKEWKLEDAGDVNLFFFCDDDANKCVEILTAVKSRGNCEDLGMCVPNLKSIPDEEAYEFTHSVTQQVYLGLQYNTIKVGVKKVKKTQHIMNLIKQETIKTVDCRARPFGASYCYVPSTSKFYIAETQQVLKIKPSWPLADSYYCQETAKCKQGEMELAAGDAGTAFRKQGDLITVMDFKTSKFMFSEQVVQKNCGDDEDRLFVGAEDFDPAKGYHAQVSTKSDKINLYHPTLLRFKDCVECIDYFGYGRCVYERTSRRLNNNCMGIEDGKFFALMTPFCFKEIHSSELKQGGKTIVVSIIADKDRYRIFGFKQDPKTNELMMIHAEDDFAVIESKDADLNDLSLQQVQIRIDKSLRISQDSQNYDFKYKEFISVLTLLQRIVVVELPLADYKEDCKMYFTKKPSNVDGFKTLEIGCYGDLKAKVAGKSLDSSKERWDMVKVMDPESYPTKQSFFI